jgi:hypothetical protein
MDANKIYIEYFLIGQLSTKTILFEYEPINDSSNSKKKASFEIFEKYCSQDKLRTQERDQINSPTGNYYIAIGKADIICIAFVLKSYPQRTIYELMENIIKNKIPLSNVINYEYEIGIRNEIDKYQNINHVDNFKPLHNDIQEVKVEIRQNLKTLATNIDKVHELDVKAERIKEGAKTFEQDAIELKRVTWWNNCRLTIIIGLLVIGIILAIVLPIVLKK